MVKTKEVKPFLTPPSFTYKISILKQKIKVFIKIFKNKTILLCNISYNSDFHLKKKLKKIRIEEKIFIS